MQELQWILDDLNVKATVVDKVEGVRTNTYYVVFKSGVKTLPTEKLKSIIMVRLGGNSIRLREAPERKCFAFEVSFLNNETVEISEIIKSETYKTSMSKYKYVIGKTSVGEIVIDNLPEAKNVLIAGQAGSGKSVGINVIIASLLQESPKDLKFIMIDPKRVELTGYNGIPHLLAPVITEQASSLNALRWIDKQVRYRYSVLEKIGETMKGSAFKNIDEYNNRLNRNAIGYKYLFSEDSVDEVDTLLKSVEICKKLETCGLIEEYKKIRKTLDDMYKYREIETRKNGVDVDGFRKLGIQYENMKLPRIVVVIDELADLIMGSKDKETENFIIKIGQLGRAAGVHLIVATQRPSADIISPLIKANLQTKIAYAVSSASNSRIILDESGAEKLLGKGDMLYKSENDMTARRVQGAYISSDEIDKMLNYIKSNNSSPVYDDELMKMLNDGGYSGDRVYRYFNPYALNKEESDNYSNKEAEEFDELYMIDNFVDTDD